MKEWNEVWLQVEQSLVGASTRDEALGAVRELRGGPTTWDALARAGRRRGVNVSTLLRQGMQVSSVQGDPNVGPKHIVIPDTQCKAGVPNEHFSWIGKYIAAKQPDVVVHLGDHWDMPSLSVYESATVKASKGVHKIGDIEAGNVALELLEAEFVKANYQPKRKVLLEGNHDGFAEHGRVGRYLKVSPEDEGLITKEQFADSWLGWERVPFLSSIVIDDIRYGHLFPFSSKGTQTASTMRNGAASAKGQLEANMQSCTAGHKQGLDTHIHNTPNQTYRSIIAGSCYLHNEDYLGPNQNYWRGILVKHDVRASNPNHYDLMEVSLEFLKRRFG